MSSSEYVTGSEFGRWRNDFNEFQNRLEARLNSDHQAVTGELNVIKGLQREANGKTAEHARLIAIILRDLETVRAEEVEIDEIVKSIQDVGCRHSRPSTIPGADSVVVIPCDKRMFVMPSFTNRQKIAVGAGVGALLIPAMTDVVKFATSVVTWLHTFGVR